MAEVSLNNISKKFNDVTAVENLSLTINDGEFMVLLGPSGAGKTTILRLISGLEKPDNGEICIAKQQVSNLSPAQRNIAMVFQQYSLYPHLTVKENLAFPLLAPISNMPKKDIEHTVNKIAEMLKISHKLNNKASALSGGEMQRVSIGKSLVRQPSVFLMDEPLSSLDAKLRADLRVELKKIQSELGATMLYVTHDQIEAMTMAERIGVLQKGRLVQLGSPAEIYENPINAYVASRLGQPKINIISVADFSNACSGKYFDMPVQAHHVGIRAENIELMPEGQYKVRRIEHLGDHCRVYIDVYKNEIIALARPEYVPAQNERLNLKINKPVFFDASGKRI